MRVTRGSVVAVVVFGLADEPGVTVDDVVMVAETVDAADEVPGADSLAVADAELAADAVPPADALPVAAALLFADALVTVVAAAVVGIAGEVLTELPDRGVVVAGVLGWGVGIDGKLEPGPLGVQAETAITTSSAPVNVVRRTVMKPPRYSADKRAY